MKAQRSRKLQAFQQRARFPTELRVSAAEARYVAFEGLIRSIPIGKVASYGQIAEAAGYPRGHRLVARFLRDMYYNDLPWQRVVGASGEIKVRGRTAARQRSLLKAEGVICSGSRIDMARYRHVFD